MKDATIAAASASTELDWALRHVRELERELALALPILALAKRQWNALEVPSGCPVPGCGVTSLHFEYEGQFYARCTAHRATWPSSKAKFDEWVEATKQAEEARKARREEKPAWPF